MNNTLKSDRIEVVDALRGVALFAIVILHCFEHFIICRIVSLIGLRLLIKVFGIRYGSCLEEKPFPLFLFFLDLAFLFSLIMQKNVDFLSDGDLCGE